MQYDFESFLEISDPVLLGSIYTFIDFSLSMRGRISADIGQAGVIMGEKKARIFVCN